MNEKIQAFLTVIAKQKRYSEHRVEAYRRDIEEFQAYLEKEAIGDFDEVDYTMLRGFLSELYDRALEPSTIARKLSSLRSFYDYLLEEKLINDNPFLLIHAPKQKRQNPDFLYEDEVELLLDHIDTHTDLGIRNKAMLELMYASGLRASEVVELRLANLDLNACLVHVLGKGKKERLVPFHPYCQQWLMSYVTEARENIMLANGENHDVVFVNQRGKPLTTRGLRDILDRTSLKAGLGRHIHPHALRHTFASTLLDHGADIRFVQEMLGHASLSTTQIYTHISMEKLKQTYLQTHPLAKTEKEEE